MKLIRIAQVSKEPATGALFTGGPVTLQRVVTQQMDSKNFSVSMVNFARGARNKFHAHSTDQVLIVTAGTGIVDEEEQESVVGGGDIIHVPVGEEHWHEATKESEFSHISLSLWTPSKDS